MKILVLDTFLLTHLLADDTVDVTSEPVEQEQSMPSSHNPYKTGQMEVELGGSVTLQCPQGEF